MSEELIPWDELPKKVRDTITTGFIVFFVIGFLIGAGFVLLVEAVL